MSTEGSGDQFKTAPLAGTVRRTLGRIFGGTDAISTGAHGPGEASQGSAASHDAPPEAAPKRRGVADQAAALRALAESQRLPAGGQQGDGEETVASPDSGAAAAHPTQGSVAPAPPRLETQERAAGLAPKPSRRAMFRTNTDLPANLDVGGKQQVSVRIQNVSGSGAAVVLPKIDLLLSEELWLDLALPNRPKPLELQVRVVHTRSFTNSAGEPQQILHVAFPSIRRGEQDAIIAYINNIRLYEDKQYLVAALVKMEVVTGRRRFAKFTGQTMQVRPDKMKLLMDDFDAIAGAEVMLTIMAPHFSDHLDVDDVIVDKVDVVGPRKAEVEVSLKKPDDKVLLFIRKHYPGVAKGRR